MARFAFSITLLGILAGCHFRAPKETLGIYDEYIAARAAEIDCGLEESVEIDAEQHLDELPVFPLADGPPPEYWELALHDAITLALTNSKVLRDLGGSVIQSPDSIQTVYDPAIRATDPRFGVEAALSDFDAVLTSSLQAANNDRAFNNQFFGGGTRILKQDVLGHQLALTKRSATGAVFTARHNTDYDASNAPGNRFPSAWNSNVEMQARQPLLQGRGLLFNRIAGTGTLGTFNGVLIAKLNTDIDLADFEVGVRDFVSNVENAYWDLYFAYRNLDAKITARNASLETWRKVHALYLAGRRGGEAEKESQALGQYHRFELDVENALYGESTDGTRTNVGIAGGSFRGLGGVYTAEQRLRLLMGLPSHDGRLIRPVEEPVMVKVIFDGRESTEEALTRRAELRKQRIRVKRSEMELFANRNFLHPKLDAVGLYRWRGFGQGLIRDNNIPFDNAYQNLVSGDFQEWQLGFELDIPIGMRRAHAAVRNAQLKLSREQSILREQQRDTTTALYQALLQLERTYRVAQASYNVREAAQQELGAVDAAYDAGKAPLDQVLDAQRRLADSVSRFHRSTVDYVIAIKNVHYAKGSYFDYHGLILPTDLNLASTTTSIPNELSVTTRAPMSYVMEVEDPVKEYDSASTEPTEPSFEDDSELPSESPDTRVSRDVSSSRRNR